MAQFDFAIPFGLRQLIAAFLSRGVVIVESLGGESHLQNAAAIKRKESGDESPHSKVGKSGASMLERTPPTIAIRQMHGAGLRQLGQQRLHERGLERIGPQLKRDQVRLP